MIARGPVELQTSQPVAHVLSADHAAQLRARVLDAVSCGNLWAFRSAVFHAHVAADGRQVLRPGVAAALKDGFAVGKDADGLRNSFAALCFRHNRPQMLREMLACERPTQVEASEVSTDSQWLKHLCLRFQHGQHSWTPLVRTALDDLCAHSREFVLIALEFAPHDHAVADFIRDDDRFPEAAALLKSCEMELEIARVRLELDRAALTAPRARHAGAVRAEQPSPPASADTSRRMRRDM